jgi:hypothetical protein
MQRHFGFDYNDQYYGPIYPQRRFSTSSMSDSGLDVAHHAPPSALRQQPKQCNHLSRQHGSPTAHPTAPAPSNFPFDRFPTGYDIRNPITTGLATATATATADAPFHLPTAAAPSATPAAYLS